MNEPKDCYVDWSSWNGQGWRVVHKPDCIEVRPHEHDDNCPHHQP